VNGTNGRGSLQGEAVALARRQPGPKGGEPPRPHKEGVHNTQQRSLPPAAPPPEMGWSVLATACAAALAATGTDAFMEQLPLRVLAITPNGEAPVLRGSDAITVTFSRAVIALGADFGPGALPAELTPFTLTGAGAAVEGRLRWVTTFSARFDPAGEWPTDLDFDQTLDSGKKRNPGAREARVDACRSGQCTAPSGGWLAEWATVALCC
jgi:hypothetical protein